MPEDHRAVKKQRRRRRRLLGVLIFLFVLVVAGWLSRGRWDDWARQALESRFAAATGGELRFDEFRLAPGLRGVRFGGLEASFPLRDGGRVRLSSGPASASFSWIDLIASATGRYRLGDVEVERPVVEVDAGEKAAPTRTIRIDWKLGRLVVRDGAMRYRDHVAPLAFAARKVEVAGAWDVAADGLRGQIGLELELQKPPLVRPLPLRLESAFLLRGEGIRLEAIRAEGPGLSVEDGTLATELGADAALDTRAAVRIDLDELGPWLPEDWAVVSGGFAGSFAAHRIEGELQWSGLLQSDRLRLGDHELTELEARVTLQRGLLAFRGIEAGFHDGRLTGEFSAALGEGPTCTLDVESRGAALASVLGALQSPWPLDGLVDLSLAASGPCRLDGLEGAGELRVRPIRERPGRVPLAIAGGYRLGAGRIRGRELPWTVGATTGTLDLDYPLGVEGGTGEARFTAASADLGQTRRLGLRLLAGAGVAVPTDGVARLPWSGRGTARGRVVWPGPRTEVETVLGPGSFDGQEYRRAAASIVVGPSRIDVRGFDVEGEGYRLEGEATVDPAGLERLRLKVGEAPLDKLLAAAGMSSGALAVLEGRLSGTLELEREAGGLAGGGRITLTEGSLAGEALDRATAVLEARADRLVFDELELSGPAFAGSGKAMVDLVSGDATFLLDEGEVVIPQLAATREADFAVEGRIGGRGRLARKDGVLSGDFEIASRDASVEGVALGRVEGTLALDDLGVDVALSFVDRAAFSVTGRVPWGGESRGRWRLEMDRAELPLPEVDPSQLSARVSGSVELDDPAGGAGELLVQGELREVELVAAGRTLRSARPVPLRIGLGGGRLGPLVLEGTGLGIELFADYSPSAGWSAAARGTVDFGLPMALWEGARGSGPIDVDLRLLRVDGALDLQGKVVARKARLRHPQIPEVLQSIEGEVRFGGGRARFDDLRARFAAGELRGSGEIVLDRGMPSSVEIALDLANTRLTLPEGFRGAYEGRLRLSGDADDLLLSGDVQLLRGLYNREFTAAGTSATTSLPGESPLGVPIRLDLSVEGERNVRVLNSLVDLEVRVGLDVRGTTVAPELTGRIWIQEGGQVNFRNVDYKIESGSLDFFELRGINPYIDVRAETQVRSYRVLLHVEGYLDRLEYRLSSDPSLSESNIVALLTTGRTIEDLGPSTASLTGVAGGDVVANYFAGALTAPVERQLQRLLGLERFQIDPFLVEGQADPTTRLTVGKQVGNTVFLTYSEDLSSKSERRLYQVEWQATPKVRLAARDTLEGVGADVSYTGRFWGGFDLPDPEQSGVAVDVGRGGETGPSLEPRPVGSIEIAGVDADVARDLKQNLTLREGDAYSRSKLFEGAVEVRRGLAARQRLEATVEVGEVDERGNAPVDVRYDVEPGPRVTIELEGVGDRQEKRIREALDRLWAGSVFPEEIYLDGDRRIMETYHDRGFYSVDVYHEVEDGDDGRAVRFHVDPGEPVRVTAVSFAGHEAASTQELETIVETRPDGAFTRHRLRPDVLERDRQVLRGFYRDLGYLDVRIPQPEVRLSTDGDAAKVVFSIDEGKRYSIRAIDLPADLPLDGRRVVEASGLRVGDPFSPTATLEAERALRRELDQIGFPEAQVAARIDVEQDGVAVTFSVRPGARRTVGEIEIRGNLNTKRRVISRELTFKSGDPLSRDALLRSQHRLYRLGIFRTVRVEYERLVGRERPSRVTVSVEESPPVRLVVGGGYDGEGGASGLFTLSHSNPGGRGRRVAFQGRANGLERRLQLVTEDPYLFGRRINGLLNLFWEESERPAFTVQRRAAAIRIERKRARRWTNFYRYNFQQVDLSDVEDSLAVQQQKLENVRLGDLGYTIVRESRDDPFNPTRGGYASAELRWFDPVWLSDSRFAKLFVQASKIKTFRNGITFATSVRVGASTALDSETRSQGIPISERFFAGGDSTLRGFPRDGLGPVDPVSGLPTGGQAILLLNEEFRFPLRGPLKAVLFLDVGNLYRTPGDVDLSDLRESVGAGFRFETPIGPLRIEYGRKLDRRPGESEGELFFAIGSFF